MGKINNNKAALTWEEEGGQAESESPPASSLVRKPSRSHRGPEVRRGERSSPQKPAGRRRRSGPAGALRGSRSAAAVAGGGRAGSARRGAVQASAAGSSEAQMPAASSTSHAPLRSPPRAGPALSFHAELREGTHPRRGCPAARCPGSGPARSRPPARLRRAGVQGRRPWGLWWWGGGPGGGGRAGAQAAVGALRGGRMPGRLGGGLRADSRQVRAPPAAIRTMWRCPGAEGAARLLSLFLCSPAPASPRSAVMSGGRG